VADIFRRPVGFDDETALRPAGDGVWEGAIADGWGTPRGPLGGYVMAIVLRALELVVDDPERTPRSATMHFLRVPQVGPVTVRAKIERQGRSLTSVSARLEQEGKLLGLALGAYSKAWPGPTLDESPMPEVDPPDARRPIESEFPRDNPPAFTGRLSMQHRFGDAPFTGSDRAEVGGWLGLLDERVRLALRVPDHPGRRLLGLGPDVAGGLPGGLEDPGRLDAEQLHQPVLVQLLGELGTSLGALRPVQLVRLAPLEPPDDLRQFVEEGTHLGGVVALPSGGKMSAGDARRIEGRRLGRHDPRWYDSRRPRAEGRFSRRSGWWPARWGRSQPCEAAGWGRSSTFPPRSARAASASSSVSTAMTSTSPACCRAAS